MLIGLIALTLPLCLDSFLIAAAIGISRPGHGRRLQIAATLAAFEGGMPLIGLAIGNALAKGLGDVAQYVAIAILIGFGTYSGLRVKQEDDAAARMAGVHGLTLVALGLSIGLDGLAIGFSYGLLHVPVVAATIAIVAQAVVAMEIGFAVGSRLPDAWRHAGEKLANWILVVIGGALLVGKLVHI